MTETEALPKLAKLEEVAKELKKHLEVLEKAKVESILKVRGYAVSSGSCNYNLRLSQERADWVVGKLKNHNKLRNEYSLKLLESAKTIGCGKAFSGDVHFKDFVEERETKSIRRVC